MAYEDRIGDRLDHPERVPKEFQHLIADDRQRVERILSFPVSGRVLDVGCSDGAITRRIAEKWKVDAIGSDACFRADGRTASGLLRWVAWDIRRSWPLHDPSVFDAIYACEVFEHLTDADAQTALTNILAVLKPGGDLIVTVPNRHPHDLYEVGCRSRWAWPDHRSAWTGSKLHNFLMGDFTALDLVRLYDHDRLLCEPLRYFETDSIWLIVHAKGKR